MEVENVQVCGNKCTGVWKYQCMHGTWKQLQKHMYITVHAVVQIKGCKYPKVSIAIITALG